MKMSVYCLVAALLGTVIAGGQDRDGSLDRSAVDDGVEVLTRGPVHEAFAGTITFDPQPGVVVRRPAPEPIEELPPDQKPTGDNLAWIPGYWAWDDERDDYLWVSGIWRSLPPGRQWISGYWATSARDSQWTSGYWADAQASEVEYLPEPPQSVEAGPNIQAPSVDHTWLPGCWIWQQNRYAWQPGYWATPEPNWVWNPPHYVWAPRGYVFVDGYYDYPVARRGVLFAPVFFSSNAYAQASYSFSPRTVINPAVFAAHLFLRPSYGHYYFGDYYGNDYATSGFSPWFSFSSSRTGYDPFYAHQRWNHRDDRQWNQRLEREFAYRRNNAEARPPQTWSDQHQRRNRDGANRDNTFVVTALIEELVRSENTDIRFQPLAQQEREQFSQRGQQVREAIAERRQLEAEAVGLSSDAAVRNVERPIRVRLPKSPVRSQPDDRLNEDNALPKTLDATPGDPQSKPLRDTPEDERQSAPTRGPGVATQPDTRPLAPGDVPQPAAKDAPRADARGADARGADERGADERGAAPMSDPKITPSAESPQNAPGAAPTVTPQGERPPNTPKVAPPAAAQINSRPESPGNAPQPASQVKPRPEPLREEAPKAAKAKPKSEPRPEQPRPEQPRPEQPRPEQPRPEQPKPEQPRPEQPKPEQPKPEQPKPEQPRPEQPRPEQPRPEQPKPEQPRPEQPKPEQPRPEPEAAKAKP